MSGVRTSLFSPPSDCPVSHDARRNTYARALHRACVILGSMEGLASHLGVAQADLARWLQGEEPPFEVFLAAVEVVLLHLDAPGTPS